MLQNILEIKDSLFNKDFTKSFLKDSFDLNHETVQWQMNSFSPRCFFYLSEYVNL